MDAITRAIQRRIDMDDDYKRFCIPCHWDDADLGCSCPSGEEVWQCDLYRHYHPEEVKEFEKSIEDWYRNSKEGENVHINRSDNRDSD